MRSHRISDKTTGSEFTLQGRIFVIWKTRGRNLERRTCKHFYPSDLRIKSLPVMIRMKGRAHLGLFSRQCCYWGQEPPQIEEPNAARDSSGFTPH